MPRKRNMNKVIELPKKGRLIVVTDIHGNKDDFDKYIDIWDDKNPFCHILFLGDLIHEVEYGKDLSLDILDEIYRYYIHLPNFHVLIGNHELAQITNDDIHKYEINQTYEFNNHIQDKIKNLKMGDITQEQGEKYYNHILRKFDYFCVTDNGFFFSHAGISNQALDCLINQSVDLFNLDINEPTDYKFLDEMLWSRPYDEYTEKEINTFLDITKNKFMCVGHTPQNGMHVLGNQLIFDSSFCTDNKYYLDIDLSKDYKDIFEVIKCLEVLE